MLRWSAVPMDSSRSSSTAKLLLTAVPLERSGFFHRAARSSRRSVTSYPWHGPAAQESQPRSPQLGRPPQETREAYLGDIRGLVRPVSVPWCGRPGLVAAEEEARVPFEVAPAFEGQ